ncbi:MULTISPECIES: ABC transporter substrate-binding protein [Dethiosulfovibrio]|uniref:ABC transporter substrate-binding protein n=2 Tax=Dethiosulfovibrio TaxID=47054 RepID=A0ABS9EQI8_9BACT|nr:MULTISPECIES: ABC transporter substrate-binding protein [Dethiosulfovibrio]MEA3283772.1 ABC transporter substrate-binding protein [Synergistota bacterium]MCF4115106.1 ABC transporter substrate-binding protein [Dethiosulfovibrio russensis]MCF4143452.1 ABC transporter substrate-binding protein [Dethiosulfovibrio marinus]MCF4145733.1 ABC transporter substrate-binding protein [Dethiosulfovibrio acidaminovorans]MCF4151913.1 ABC transporter substrate-binding protein [Dethiosulfovibrio faecalis]
MLKRIIGVMCAVTMVFLMVASGYSEEKGTFLITVGTPKAPPALPLLYMMENNTLGDEVRIKLDFWSEAETLIAMVQDKKHHFLAFPLTVMSKLYNKGLDVRLLNVNTWGVTYFITTDREFRSWSDLRGKDVYVNLKSSPPDVFTRCFLEEAGLDPEKDVNIVYASMPEVAAMIASGRAEYATLIEPMATKVLMSNPKARVGASFEEEWRRINKNDSRIPNAGMGVMGDFAKKNPDLVEDFQKGYEEGLIWTLEHPEEAGKLAEKYLALDGELLTRAIPSMGLHFEDAMEAKADLDLFFGFLLDFDPRTIGGRVPDDGMYYVED